MDFHVRQWKALQQLRNHSEEEEEQEEGKQHPVPASAKMLPPFLHSSTTVSSSPPQLQLFAVPEPTTTTATNTATHHHHHHLSPAPSPPTRMGGFFSVAQWQELELQTLIFRHLLVGACVPPDLLHQVKKSLLLSASSSSSSSSHHYYLQPPRKNPSLLFTFLLFFSYLFFLFFSVIHSGYFGRAAVDPEPGRCRRTDGKKWRCANDAVAGQKYCDRHMHRGRNRSRKPVEMQVGASTGGGEVKPTGALPLPPPSIDIAAMSPVFARSSELETVFDRSHGCHTLRHFFSDAPSQPSISAAGISITAATGESCCSSDTSLKLCTGNLEEAGPGWGGGGGPLAEALRSPLGFLSN